MSGRDKFDPMWLMRSPCYGIVRAEDPVREARDWYTAELDPRGLDPHAPGAKLDAGKPKVATFVLRYFPRALVEVSRISEFGALKYTPGGWRHVEEGVERYEDAEVRHILKEAIEGEEDSDSGLLHKAHKAWCALASLELALMEQEKQ